MKLLSYYIISIKVKLFYSDKIVDQYLGQNYKDTRRRVQ